MEKNELELVPTADLIKELFSRKTFAGVMVFGEGDHRFSGQKHKIFVQTSVNKESALRFLEIGVATIEKGKK